MLLIGAGGHAKVLCDALWAAGRTISAYVDRRPAPWLEAKQIENDEMVLAFEAGDTFAIGFAGVAPEALETRYELFEKYRRKGLVAPPVVDPRAIVSPLSEILAGAQILAGAVVNSHARIGAAAIVNTRAVIEHDAKIGRGAHIAPGAIVLGGAEVGDFCMIGSGAVVLPANRVPDRTLVPAASRYPK